MTKTMVLALVGATAIATSASAGNVEAVTTEQEIIMIADDVETGSLRGSAGKALPAALALLIIGAVVSGGGS